MTKQLWRDRSFRLLLYLEWILLAVALIAAISPQAPPFRSPSIGENFRPPPRRPPRPVPVGAIGCIGLLGLLGLRLPGNSRLQQIFYTALGFGLCWLAVFLGGRRETLFSALLLIVVIRGCIMFPWPGRLMVAFCAYGSFLIRLILRIYFVILRHNAVRPGEITSEWLRRITFGLAFNSTLLFGLVLLCVLLLVGALLSERQSRQALTKANDRLRQYALLIENQATLQERTRIAREMHDSVGHSLTAQSIQLENALLFFSQNADKAKHHLTEAQRLGKAALRDVRQSVASLRNHPLQGRSLSAALKQLLQEFQNTAQIQVIPKIHLNEGLNPEIQTVLYRVVQEALTNIAKHSEASRVELAIASNAKGIKLEISDNGKGFQPRENTTGFGLQGMQERVEAIAGSFWLDSQPGSGCQIRIIIPVI